MSQYFYQKTINLLFNNNVWFCLPFQRQFRLFLARRLPRISFSFPFLHFPLSLIGIKTQFRSETRQTRVFEGKLFSNSETIINSIPSIQDRCDAKRNSILGYSIGNVSNVGTRISMLFRSVPPFVPPVRLDFRPRGAHASNRCIRCCCIHSLISSILLQRKTARNNATPFVSPRMNRYGRGA